MFTFLRPTEIWQSMNNQCHNNIRYFPIFLAELFFQYSAG